MAVYLTLLKSEASESNAGGGMGCREFVVTRGLRRASAGRVPMKIILTTTLVSLLSISAGFAGPKEDVKAAAAKLAEAPCYAWKATTEMPGGNFTPAPISGKCEKGGYAVVTQTREGNTSMAVMKGEKGVVKTDEGWKTAEELQAAAQGGGGGGGGLEETAAGRGIHAPI